MSTTQPTTTDPSSQIIQAINPKQLFESDTIKKKFQEMLGKKAPAFMTSVLQIVSQNTMLSHADTMSIYQAAAVAATLDLPLNNNLGFAYIIPYNKSYKDDKGKWQKKAVAQFQIGYKGFVQLAQRSNQFKSIYAAPIFEGQIISENPLDGFEFNFNVKSDKVVGYAAKFRLLNGYEAVWYMTNLQLQQHSQKYSKSIDDDKSLWNTDFDAMAKKTVLKLLLSKFAPLSIEMQTAVLSDQSVVKDYENGSFDYLDNDQIIPLDKEVERIDALINTSKTIDDLMRFQNDLKPENVPTFEAKLKELQEKK